MRRIPMTVVLSLAAVTALIAGCSDDSIIDNTIDVESTVKQIRTVDIADASTVFVGKATGDQDSRLYKFSDDGAVSEVTYRDELGETLTLTLPPERIINLGNEYVLFGFSALVPIDLGPNVVIPEHFDTVLVRKSDGAAFLVSDEANLYPHLDFDPWSGDPDLDRSRLRATAYTDDKGNIYYLSLGERGLRASKIDARDPEQLTREFITPDADPIETFVAGGDGGVVYRNIDGDLRMLQPNNELEPINLTEGTFWRGLDGHVRVQEYLEAMTEMEARTSRVEVDGQGRSSLVDEGGSVMVFENLDYFRFDFAEYSILIGHEYLLELDNPAGTPRQLTMPVQTLLDAQAVGEVYYVAGTNDQQQTVVLEMTPGQDTGVPVITLDDDLDVKAIEFIGGGNLYFEALRLSDSAEVFGQIAPDGTVSLLDERPFDGEIQVLQRLD